MGQEDTAVPQDLRRLSRDNEITSQHDGQPPSAVPSNGRVGGVDITTHFFQSARAIGPGELVKDDFFTLFESVGALEVMDPKMDSGFLQPGESLDTDFDLNRPLLPEEVLGIIDQLLCHEMAWHLGYPLSQTLFTSVYIDAMLKPSPATITDADFIRHRTSANPISPMHAVLRAYCLGLLKACWYVNERIRLEHYYEEEDFVTNTYQRRLLDDIDREMIREAIQDARAILRKNNHQMPEELSTALDLRLELRYAFLRAIELSELRSNPSSLKTPWLQLLSILEPINGSHSLAVPVPEAFTTKFQRRLASTMPPRPIVQISFEDAYTNFQRLFKDGMEVGEVLNFHDAQSLLSFVMSFQRKKPQPLVYVRTLLQSFLFKDMIILGSMSIRQVLDDDLSIVVLPSSPLLDKGYDAVEAPHDARFAIAHQMEVFRQRSSQSYLDILRAFCQNRCRVRRTLCHSILDWETVQVDAEEIDQLLQVQIDEEPVSYLTMNGGTDPAYSLPLSSWAYLYKLRLMEWIVQLGFELEVYQPDELAGMYWYLNHLAKTRAQHIERIKVFTSRSLNKQRSKPQNFTAAKEAAFTQSLSYLRLTMLDATVTWEFADGLSCLYAALLRLKLVPEPERPYGSSELRYELRMKPFAPIGLPDLPPYDVFSNATKQSDVPVATLLDYADKAISGARKGYDVLVKLDAKEAFTVGTHDRWVGATQNCKRAVIAAGIAIATVRKALNAGQADLRVLQVEVPPPDKAYHDWWIVPKVSRKG